MWVDIRPESARCQRRLLELKPRRRWRRRRSYNNDGDAGTRNGNNIDDGSGDVGVLADFSADFLPKMKCMDSSRQK